MRCAFFRSEDICDSRMPKSDNSCINKTRFILWAVFSGGWDGKESACNVGDPGSIPGLGRALGEGNGYSFQYSFFFLKIWHNFPCFMGFLLYMCWGYNLYVPKKHWTTKWQVIHLFCLADIENLWKQTIDQTRKQDIFLKRTIVFFFFF